MPVQCQEFERVLAVGDRVINPFNCMILIVLCMLSPFFAFDTAGAGSRVKMLLTSNTQGNFSLDIENQETNDRLLMLAQNIIVEKAKGVDVLLDLGNAFYPGALSKFSSGSIVADFLDYFSFDASLVSSRDLHIGLKNLEFLQTNRRMRLISTNIVRGDEPVFKPWFAIDARGLRMAFVGISSEKISFDIAEKNLYGITLKDAGEALAAALRQIEAAGIRHIFLLSGLKLSDTMMLLEKFPQIGLALCGGDYTGALFSGKISRLELEDGRAVVVVDGQADYTLLELDIDTTVSIQALKKPQAAPLTVADHHYLDFKERLTIWKRKYQQEQDQSVADLSDDDKQHVLDDRHLARLLQDRFKGELAIVEKNTLLPTSISRDISRSDLLNLVNLDYNIFTFYLNGEQVRSLDKQAGGLVVTGLERKQELAVQGYALRADHRYLVAATQSAFEKVEQILAADIPYHNSWVTVNELLTDDLQGPKIALRSDYDYLDRRFRLHVDAFLANMVDSSSVDRGANIDTPVGQPAESYSKWGLENRFDIAVYNKYHRFVLTPYMLYMRQDDQYLHNLLRGTLLYEYNMSDTYKPYNKFQYDTVVVEVDGLRPSLIRETAGVAATYKYIQSRLGLGFEKEVQDPADDALYGLEFILAIRYPIFANLIYSLDLDTFSATASGGDEEWQVRSSIENALSVPVNSYLSLSVRHRYFYLHDAELDEEYRNSQIITSLDLKMGWKFW